MGKQNSIDWLAEQMLHPEIFNPYIEQAKAMHKKEVEDAYQKGRFSGQTNWGYGNDITAEQYYNETFNNENTNTTT